MPATEPSRPSLEPAALSARLASPRWRLEVVEASPSTNADVARRARQGEAEGLVLVAEHQTAGRGRMDRTWVTPARSALTMSVLLTPDEVPVARWPWLPLLTGVAVRDGVRRASGLTCTLKWPNDVLVDDPSTGTAAPAKVAGILVERVEGPHGAAAVLGIGINVSTTREELPVDTATSLALAGADVDRGELLVQVLGALADHYDAWRSARGDAGRGLRPTYAGVCDTLGRTVRVDLPTGDVLTGEAVGVDADGRLEVDTPTGRVALGAGDVVHVRRTGR